MDKEITKFDMSKLKHKQIILIGKRGSGMGTLINKYIYSNSSEIKKNIKK